MSRPLRLEFEGAFWHVTSRGNERKDIFRGDGDRLLFLSLLAAAVKRFRWRLHEYCLMTNHYHLVIETPFRTLAKGMHWLNSEYVRIFNKRYERVGHLFQGRYKGILVDEQNYLDEVRRYTVLNPIRAGMVADPAAGVLGVRPLGVTHWASVSTPGCGFGWLGTLRPSWTKRSFVHCCKPAAAERVVTRRAGAKRRRPSGLDESWSGGYPEHRSNPGALPVVSFVRCRKSIRTSHPSGSSSSRGVVGHGCRLHRNRCPET